MPIIDGEYWQIYRPDGYILKHSELWVIAKNPERHTIDRYKPEPSLFLKTLEYQYDDNEQILEFVNSYGLLYEEYGALRELEDKDADLNIIGNRQGYITQTAFFSMYLNEISDAVDHITSGLSEDQLDLIIKRANKAIDKYVNVSLNKSFMNKVYFDYTPKNILAQMWINLAKFAVGETKFKQCEYSKCKNWFEIPPSKSSNPQRFCSNSHRVMSYRK